MKPYLVDVPVAIQAFIRPQMLAKQWEVIKEARPSIIFVRSDGPRDTVPTDAELIRQSRAITEDVDWDCTVYRLYEEKNIGMYAMMKKCPKFIWEKVDRCIFLEDDQVPSVSFFRFCAELLEKYKDDLRIERITSVNLCGQWPDTPDDYFFARVPASSGTAMWRRSFESRDLELTYAKNPYVMAHVKRDLPWYLKKQFVSFAETGTYANHAPGGEFFARHAEYLKHQLVIVPKYNMVANIGVGAGSTHTGKSMASMPKGLQKQYGMKTYEYTFPLKHPAFVFPDTKFEKEREKHLGVASRWQSWWRSIERTFRLLFTGEGGKLIKGIKKRLFKHTER